MNTQSFYIKESPSCRTIGEYILRTCSETLSKSHSPAVMHRGNLIPPFSDEECMLHPNLYIQTRISRILVKLTSSSCITFFLWVNTFGVQWSNLEGSREPFQVLLVGLRLEWKRPKVHTGYLSIFLLLPLFILYLGNEKVVWKKEARNSSSSIALLP